MFTLLWSFIVWAAPYVALYVGLHYLNMSLTPDLEDSDISTPDPQSRSWNAHTTQNEGIVRPRAYGKNMHHGNIVAKWTGVSGDEREILYMIIEHGDGPTQGIGANIVYLNNQPAGNYGDVSIEERLGTMNQTCMTGFEKTKLEYQIGDELKEVDGPLVFTTPNDKFDDLEYTLMFPNGLIAYHKDGEHKAAGVQIKVRISEQGLSAWTEIFNEIIWGEQTTPLFKLYKVSDLGYNCVCGTQYDLEFTRISIDNPERHTDTSYVKSVREVVDVAFTRPGKALIGITAIATSQLSGNVDVKVVREDRVINTYNGAVWTIEYSRNRAWVVFDILTQPVISGDGDGNPYVIERYEGINPDKLDIDFFYDWAIWCDVEILDGYGGTEARMPCDIIIDYETDIWTLANEIAKIGRAYLYWQGNVLTGWIDKAVTNAIDLVTMDNILSKSWRNAWVGTDKLTGAIEVLYQDARQGYERMPAPFGNINAGTYTQAESIEGVGITSRGVAIHVANFAFERSRLIRNTNFFKVFKDGFRYALGDVIKLQHKKPNWGRGFRVIDSTNNTVELDRIVEAKHGDILYVRTFDVITGVVGVYDYTVDTCTGKTVTIQETWTVSPAKNNIIAIDTSSHIKTRRIIKLEPSADNYFDVTVETYDEELFDADDLDPNNPDKNYIYSAPPGNLTQPVTRQEVTDLISQLLPAQPDIDMPVTSNLTWTGDDVDTVSWEKTDADYDITFRYRGVTYSITPDSTTDEFIYWNPGSATVFLSTNLASTALAAGNWLMCINRDGVAYPANAIQLLHAGVILAGTIRAEQYAELRNTYVYNGDDSLDSTKPLEIPFKIVSEMTAIQSVKLSFRIMPYRAYSTAAESGGGSTSGAYDHGVKTSSGPADWDWYAVTGGINGIAPDTGSGGAVNTSDADLSTHYHTMPSHDHDLTVPSTTDNENLSTHYHTMGTHDHDISGETQTADGPGSHSHNLSSYNVDCSSEDPGDTGDTNLGSHDHGLPSGYSWTISNEDPGDTYTANLGSHHHTGGAHVHEMGEHTHDLDSFGASHTHTVTVGSHTHSTPDHVHTIAYGIHEESNSPTVHYHIDNGGGFGGASGNFGTDQLDIDITASITGSGWKAIRFDTDLRCRIFAIIEAKIDLTA